MQWKHGNRKSECSASKKVNADSCDECTSSQNLKYNTILILSIFLNCRNPASKQQISPSDRLTIYFHAVLSKDFSFNPEKDFICVRAGGNIGNWENDLVQLSVLRLVKFSRTIYSLFTTGISSWRTVWLQGSWRAWISCWRGVCMQKDWCCRCAHPIQVCGV